MNKYSINISNNLSNNSKQSSAADLNKGMPLPLVQRQTNMQ